MNAVSEMDDIAEQEAPKWSPQQAAALDSVAAWHRDWKACTSPPIKRVFGFAGTGKTTLARHFAASIDGKTEYCAFTGKAAIVMRKNGCDGASTIHNLIYAPKENSKTGEVSFTLNSEDSPASDADLIVVDECSMVNSELGEDLLSFKKPILVLGDPAQLPPVKGGGFFTDAEPDVMLTEVHRQAENNPIIAIATDVRNRRAPKIQKYGESAVLPRSKVNAEMVMGADQVLVGRNQTRSTYNRRMRELHGFGEAFPMKGERLVCLRNNRESGLFNGGLFEVSKSAKPANPNDFPDCVRFSIASEDFPGAAAIEVVARNECFDGRNLQDVDFRERKGKDEFDFGYALTVHKSQGSQWDDVVIFDESSVFRDTWWRWLYTGVTRAASRVHIII